jgi:uncharacterized membrane protein YgdD (TMEM256/DUF423 family)
LIHCVGRRHPEESGQVPATIESSPLSPSKGEIGGEKNNMKKWVIISGISGFIAVALGAFGAHGLKSQLTPEMLEIFKTGVFYHLIHSVVLLAIGLSNSQKFNKSAIFISIGILLFSFSLYLYSVTAIKFFTFITPFGGVSLLVGWAMVVYKGLNRRLH